MENLTLNDLGSLTGANVIVAGLTTLVWQLLNLIPKLIVAIIIWFIGKWLIGIGVALIRKIDIPGTNIDDRAIKVLAGVVSVLGKVFLVLIILDYLGIGETLIAAVAGGLTITIAVALGMAFGRALEPDATRVMAQVRPFFTQAAKKAVKSGNGGRKR